ncbi:MAG TPA: transglutaminaseTgpA domain-containing protein, partial [Thermodesulfovibrionales bacterium]|nr:transglutaminaseTgpA domain-containing protein [Thermodesulfovibrionales bacterium]
MPTLYKTITAILAVTGCLSLLVTGELNLLMCAGGLALLPGYYRSLKGFPQASRRAGAVLAQAALLVFLTDAFVISGDVFLAVAHMTITFQGIKSFDLKEPWDHLQVYFMSLLQLIIASELTRALTFGVIFVAFMILLVTAMVFSHFLKEGALGRVRLRRPVTIIVALTMVFTTFFFIVLPRTPQRFIGKSHF